MSLNVDFIQKANEAVAKVKSFKMSELAGQMLNLTQSIKLTKKPIDKDEQEIDENILKRLSKMESKFHENYLPELLLEIGKDYGEQENDAINLAINPLA
ncbi:hypothetical protein [Campylobacter sp. RM16187]|uniref:hypothetical protein n=1 Tax=Campylobacter sp. RM16187 TaxID=1660063 RepID=UPI0021B60D71|nr:hypothetical protein [Campylobacter sp. RM16187]QKG29981.1 hypothetical protein CDOMF_1749 [Campylobacter sp. RM16187]